MFMRNSTYGKKNNRTHTLFLPENSSTFSTAMDNGYHFHSELHVQIELQSDLLTQFQE